MVRFTVTSERRPGLYGVVKEEIWTDGEQVVVDYDFRGAISAPGVSVGSSSESYVDLYRCSERKTVEVC